MGSRWEEEGRKRRSVFIVTLGPLRKDSGRGSSRSACPMSKVKYLDIEPMVEEKRETCSGICRSRDRVLPKK